MLSTRRLSVTQPTAQQLADYTNALLTVNNYAYGITNQNMPILVYPPDDYSEFAREFAPAKQHALHWSNNIFVSIVSLPLSIVNGAASLFNLEETMIEIYLNNLISNPSDLPSKNGLYLALNTLQQIIQNQVSEIGKIKNEIEEFNTNIRKDSNILSSISNKALADVTKDKERINKINKDVDELQKEIQSAQRIIGVSEIFLGVSIYVGLIGYYCSKFPGKATKGVGKGLIIIAVGSETTAIGLIIVESLRITELQNQIDLDLEQINEYSNDVVLLNNISAQFKQLADSNLLAQQALEKIKEVWIDLNNTIELVKSELTSTETDINSANYIQALEDFKLAENSWQEVVSFANSLSNIDYSWQDSNGDWHSYTTDNPTIDGGQIYEIQSA